MIQIRNNVFETNSSSTHCMVIGKISDFEKWEKGELYYYVSYKDEHKFITRDEVIEIIKGSSYKDKDTEKAIKYLESGDLNLDEDNDEYTTLNAINEELAIHNIYTHKYYERCYEHLESEETEYTTSGGEKIRILCHYGTDY